MNYHLPNLFAASLFPIAIGIPLISPDKQVYTENVLSHYQELSEIKSLQRVARVFLDQTWIRLVWLSTFYFIASSLHVTHIILRNNFSVNSLNLPLTFTDSLKIKLIVVYLRKYTQLGSDLLMSNEPNSLGLIS